MSRKLPSAIVTDPEGNAEEVTNIIRTSKRMMVPELRASVSQRRSSLQPDGLPPPGKTTQGFRSGQKSATPQSFRTVRNFWRRLEGGAADTAPARRFGTPSKQQTKPSEPTKEPLKPPVAAKPRASALKRQEQRKSVTKRSTTKMTRGTINEGNLLKQHRQIAKEVREQYSAKPHQGDSGEPEKRHSLTVPPSGADHDHKGGRSHRQEQVSPIKEKKKSKSSASGKQAEEHHTDEEETGGDTEQETDEDLKEKEEDEEVEEEEVEEEEAVVVEKKARNPGVKQEIKSERRSTATNTGTHEVRGASSLWAALPRMFSDESLSRPSVILPVLLEEEKLFHELVAGGDVSSVRDFISRRPNFNMNCENYQGTFALQIAVKDDNEDMVQYLLSLPGIEVRDSHLHAIRDNHLGILVMILDKLKSINPALEFMACSNSPEFAENITPLILAAEAGHFEIVGLLISRGHIIPRPHKPRCFCKEECLAIMKSQDLLNISSGKLHIYRALSNPAYICQTSPDPLLVAFKLSKELLTCGHVDTIYLRQYEALAGSLRAFAVDLIAECRTLEEVETVLSESKDSHLKGNWTYPRLILAMDYKQKEFVAHPNVQQVLERTWMGDWIAWKGYRVYKKALYIFPRLVSLPMVLGFLMFSPKSKWAKHYSLPVNKMLSNLASYFIFLFLVFIQSDVNKRNQTRDTKPTGVEIFLVIYVLTFLYNSIRTMLKQGLIRFFKFMWNIYELIMEIFFIMAFIFLIAAEIRTTVKGEQDLERKYWNYWDPELISEGFFVLAAVMAFLRILLIFQISYHLGPLQVSLGKMTNDCAMFSIIFAIIILAFTAGMCKFYNYYEDMVQTNPDTGEVESTQVNSFTSVLDTFKTLFWGLFGMSSFDVADVIVENIEDVSRNATVTNEHHLTEAVGYFAFASYMILTVIVILNMLIATMSNTFQQVTDNLDTEWLFGRTELNLSTYDARKLILNKRFPIKWYFSHLVTEAIHDGFKVHVLPILTSLLIQQLMMEFKHGDDDKVQSKVYLSYIDLPVLPPPFNIIPTTQSIMSFFKGGKDTKQKGKPIGRDVEKGIIHGQHKKDEDYYVLMSQLVQRYFSTKNSENG